MNPIQKKKLGLDFYLQADTLSLAEQLLGKYLVTRLDGQLTSGKIVETEAYLGQGDRASHAYGGRRTDRTSVMFEAGGVAYVYLCYGVHSLFNVITHEEDVPHAILIRAIEPAEGVETMLERRSMEQLKPSLTAGPGVLSKALGIATRHTGLSLMGDQIWLEDRGEQVHPDNVLRSARVGVDYAGEDALLPYRFRIRGNQWVSPAK